MAAASVLLGAAAPANKVRNDARVIRITGTGEAIATLYPRLAGGSEKFSREAPSPRQSSARAGS